mmetsp:Transcript_93637/g.171778  ORF Transcript_93637/g.171778 Transcript_93637/m.171778 type:complete len:141 (-) Transcript_93637:40-462(-)
MGTCISIGCFDGVRLQHDNPEVIARFLEQAQKQHEARAAELQPVESGAARLSPLMLGKICIAMLCLGMFVMWFPSLDAREQVICPIIQFIDACLMVFKDSMPPLFDGILALIVIAAVVDSRLMPWNYCKIHMALALCPST